MPESKDEAQQRALRELEGKNVAYYSVLLSAWIQTRMERDKTLVTLSAAAIGLLVTILTTAGVRSVWEIPLYAVSVLSFLTTIWSALTVYQLNSEHLENAIRGSSERDPRLQEYDKRSTRAFIVGCLSALFIAVLSASFEIAKAEENNMSSKNDGTKSSGEKRDIGNRLDGVKNRTPREPGKKSLDGITDLKPKPAELPPGQPQQSQNTPSAPSTDSGPEHTGNDD